MPVLTAHDIAKSYGGVAALHGVDLTLESGQVHALLGENGAGKSTLVKILTGATAPDAGEIVLDGVPRAFSGPAEAADAGIAVVSQELTLFPDLDLLGNLFLTRLPTRGRLVDRAAMQRAAESVLADVGLDMDPATPAGHLTLAQRQLLEIAKALLPQPAVLVLDEPTSALDDAEASRLLRIIDAARNRGAAVVFVTHILEEVLAASDVVSILRDGKMVVSGTPRSELGIREIVSAMLGERAGAYDASTEASAATAGDTALRADAGDLATLRVDRLSGRGFHEVTFTVAPGEVVGFAGVAGSGHRAVIEAMSGIRPVRSGTIGLPGHAPTAPPRTRSAAVRAGVAIVSGDRGTSLMHEAPVWENTVAVDAVALARRGRWLSPNALRRLGTERSREVGARLARVDQAAGSLSGGNQQKIVLAAWLAADPQVVLLDDPTRGVDVGAKAEIHALLARSCRDRPVVLSSTDVEELVGVCDRVLVFRGGRVVSELTGERLDRHELLTEMNASDAVEVPGGRGSLTRAG